MRESGIDVLLVARGDDAGNAGYRYSRCLKLLGLHVRAYKQRPHELGYPEQLPLLPLAPQLMHDAREARVLFFTNSSKWDMGVDLAKKFVVCHHGGTPYRVGHKNVNAVCNEFVDASIFCTPDLLGLGAANEHWIANPVDTDTLRPTWRPVGGKVVIGHFPNRGREYKGTDVIEAVMRRLQADPQLCDRFEYVSDESLVPWHEQMHRYRRCDVLIEACGAQSPKGYKYGEWGSTALEAAALGKVVVTSCLHRELYEQEYGDLALVVANNAWELDARIKALLALPTDMFRCTQELTRDWVVKHHSYPATAKKLADRIFSVPFPHLKGREDGQGCSADGDV